MSTPKQIALHRLASGEINQEQFNAIVGNLQPSSAEPAIQSQHRWYDPIGILIMLRWVIGLYVAYSLLSILILLVSDSSSDVYYFYTYQIEGVGTGLSALLIVDIVLELTLMILVLMGFYRYASNVASVGISKSLCSPGWAVGWFFIPIANFWMPYVALSFQLRASRYGHAWDSYAPSPSLLMWFVLFWLVGIGEIMIGELGVEDMDGVAVMGPFLGLLSIVSLAFLHAFCTEITRSQSAWADGTTTP